MKSLVAYFQKHKGNTTLKFRLLGIYVIAILLITLAMFFAVQHFIFRPIYEDSKLLLDNKALMLAEDVKNSIGEFEALTSHLSSNVDLYLKLTKEYTDFNDVWQTIYSLTNSYDVFRQYRPGIKFFRIYHNNPTLVEDGALIHRVEGCQYTFPESVNKLSWTLAPTPKEENLLLLKSDITHISQKTEAFILLGMDSQKVFGNLMEVGESDIEHYYLYNHHTGEVLASSDTDSLHGKISSSLADIPVNQLVERQQNGDNYFFIRKEINANWSLLSSMSMTFYKERIHYFTVVMGLLIFSVSLLIFLLLYVLVGNIFRRLDKLGQRIYTLDITPASKIKVNTKEDEITRLEHQYNAMVERLNATVTEMTSVKVREKENQLRLLKAQISPHFLYNTLSIIRWEALESSNQNICNIVDNMTTFYRRSMQHGDALHTIQEEFEHLVAYINIQQFRYQEKVEVLYYCADEIKEYLVPKMILQPLVENAYVHGQLINLEQPTLVVSVQQKKETLVFVVEDNGVGISPEMKKAIEENQTECLGVGLRYVRDMLTIHYGTKATFEVHSQQDEGTRVIITTPIMKAREDR